MSREEQFDWREHALQEATHDAFDRSQDDPEDVIERCESALIAYTGCNLAGRHVKPTEDNLAMIV